MTYTNGMASYATLLEKRLVQNVLVWVFVWFLISIIITTEPQNAFVAAIGIVVFMMIPVYINNLKILPQFKRRNKGRALFLFLLNTMLFALIGVYFIGNHFKTFEWRLIWTIFGIVLLTLLFATAVRVSRDSFLKRQQVKDAELKLLKAQLNPHFLFNTLNNLYGLSVRKSDNLPNLMLKLSDLLRYSLYDTQESMVSLQKEAHYLENYISLERIRLEDKTNISFSITGDILSARIAPMLLIVFVENAFKHLGTTKGGESEVNISLEITKDAILFDCVNTIDPLKENHNNLETGKSGIGLQNAQKRLELLYPNSHELLMKTTGEHHRVSLKILM